MVSIRRASRWPSTACSAAHEERTKTLAGNPANGDPGERFTLDVREESAVSCDTRRTRSQRAHGRASRRLNEASCIGVFLVVAACGGTSAPGSTLPAATGDLQVQLHAQQAAVVEAAVDLERARIALDASVERLTEARQSLEEAVARLEQARAEIPPNPATITAAQQTVAAAQNHAAAAVTAHDRLSQVVDDRETEHRLATTRMAAQERLLRRRDPPNRPRANALSWWPDRRSAEITFGYSATDVNPDIPLAEAWDEMTRHCDIAIYNLDFQRNRVSRKIRHVRTILAVASAAVGLTAVGVQAGDPSSADGQRRQTIATSVLSGSSGLLAAGSYLSDPISALRTLDASIASIRQAQDSAYDSWSRYAIVVQRYYASVGALRDTAAADGAQHEELARTVLQLREQVYTLGAEVHASALRADEICVATYDIGDNGSTDSQ